MFKHLLFGGGAGAGSVLANVGLLILRLFAGLTMAFAHGFVKLQNPDTIIKGTQGMNFPAPTLFGWMAIFAEFGGGLLLAIGLLTRPAAFLIASTMIVAAFVAHGNDPFQKKELALAYLAISVLFMLAGSGRFGIDALIAPRGGGKGFPLDRA